MARRIRCSHTFRTHGSRVRFARLVVAAVFVLPLFTALTPPLLAQRISTDVEIPAYPLKASANNRYLVDQNDRPFLMIGDSPQNLITNLSPKEAEIYMANRQSYSINTLWICIP